MLKYIYVIGIRRHPCLEETMNDRCSACGVAITDNPGTRGVACTKCTIILCEKCAKAHLDANSNHTYQDLPWLGVVRMD